MHRFMFCPLWLVVAALFIWQDPARGHDHTRHAAQRARAIALAKARGLAEPSRAEQSRETQPQESCLLTLELVDAETKVSTAGLVRITNLGSGKAVSLKGEIHRALNWYSLDAGSQISVPRAKLRIEALRGLCTELAGVELDLRDKPKAKVSVPLTTFANPSQSNFFSGNTHLHLMNLTHAEADRYLRVVPRSDNLDLVFLSHLRRIPDERDYISNTIVENSFTGGDLQRLSQDGVLFGNGEEHRHNFGRGGEGYGHVMLLDLLKLIRPVSIGPGIMAKGTDGLPLRRGIQEARADGATVIWCHNTFGFEDVPNWMDGLLHAQNIFDGGHHGSYRDSFYRYLNLGLRVPFSTGTDWFIYDFSRVYVPVPELTAKSWLAGLRAGQSYITNGPLLQFNANGAAIGSTLPFSGPRQIRIEGKAEGRLDFRGLELVHNGEVIATVESAASQNHFQASLAHTLEVREPGWVALRIPLKNGKTELDRDLFAHTSPIYFDVAGKRPFRRNIAQQLIEETEANVKTIEQHGTFANEQERSRVLDVYRSGIRTLRSRIAEHAGR